MTRDRNDDETLFGRQHRTRPPAAGEYDFLEFTMRWPDREPPEMVQLFGNGTTLLIGSLGPCMVERAGLAPIHAIFHPTGLIEAYPGARLGLISDRRAAVAESPKLGHFDSMMLEPGQIIGFYLEAGAMPVMQLQVTNMRFVATSETFSASAQQPTSRVPMAQPGFTIERKLTMVESTRTPPYQITAGALELGQLLGIEPRKDGWPIPPHIPVMFTVDQRSCPLCMLGANHYHRDPASFNELAGARVFLPAQLDAVVHLVSEAMARLHIDDMVGARVVNEILKLVDVLPEIPRPLPAPADVVAQRGADPTGRPVPNRPHIVPNVAPDEPCRRDSVCLSPGLAEYRKFNLPCPGCGGVVAR